MTMKTDYIGKPTNRVDGRLKVTGQAKYAAEFDSPGLTYGFVVSSRIAKGKIKSIDTTEALQLDGVLQVFTHENRPQTAWFDKSYQDEDSPPGSPFRPLYSDEIQFSQQPIALVVADTFEAARYGATLVNVTYEDAPFSTDFEGNREKAYTPEKYKSQPPPDARGDMAAAFASAAMQISEEYTHTSEHHNPMEMHASTAIWEEDGTLTIYDKTQSVQNSQKYIDQIFGLKPKDARVRSPFVGGAFGSGLRPQYQLFLTVMAALELKRPVRVMLTRQQMFSFGHRPATIQKLQLGASKEGKLEAVRHEAFGETSRFEDYAENVVVWQNVLYQCDNVAFDYKLIGLDVYTPLDMRAPGGSTGQFALESAMDELAAASGINPVALRLKNYTEKDQNEDAPFTSKELRECYRQGAEKFGWEKRNPEPRSMKEGHQLIGWGMASGAWEASQQQASAKALLTVDGKLTVSSATADIGTGTYTVMTQLAAETLGLQLEDVSFKLGDSALPDAPLEGGSWTVSSVGSAVTLVCDAIGKRLLKLARKVKDTPFATAGYDEVIFSEGHMRLRSDPSKALAVTRIMRSAEINYLEEEVTSKPAEKQKKYAPYAHSAVFVEVRVDEDFGTIKVTRVVSAIAGGRIINTKTAESQILGGVVWGIGMALEEESLMDTTYGRFMNHNLAEYHVPVNADIHSIDVIFVEEHDEIVNPIGAKGLGEIGIAGVAGAIANAVYHATGKRVRNLPITLDKVM
ncbi:xanthine dehydrogenase family protein molybdopterin-binding subunit [Pontibacter sp. E15-1]|uniref:xanthine dehydrogenase family protein molybdopterin-binding subunit n=1 Tax=Pontibacter sp. E15-1 TaxID=2919918 RepID=UPI001F4FE1E5|nr:xanthine dehydrogenase family protein molybdopterin-binding subunit [Pontibacter sp. E15-1]MCJ8165044.1 xanthine dehydrogenase family protein molybdopterin-binding subunit [Pontibacter sp. E15-1]